MGNIIKSGNENIVHRRINLKFLKIRYRKKTKENIYSLKWINKKKNSITSLVLSSKIRKIQSPEIGEEKKKLIRKEDNDSRFFLSLLKNSRALFQSANKRKPPNLHRIHQF